MKFTLLFILSIFLLSCNQNSFKQKIEVASSTINFDQQIDSIVINKMNQYNIPGISIGIIRNDSIIYTKGFGVKNIETDELVTENSIFHTASISKLFTAIAIVQLEQKKLLNLDDKLVKLVPGLHFKDERVKEISIQNLLNHTSGLPDIGNYHWSNNHQSKNSLEEHILDLNLKLESEPNTTYYYSNLGYDVLGYIIEKVSGLTFEDYIKINILNKSDMHDSDFRFFKIPDSLKTSPHTKSWLTGNIKVRGIYPYTREHAPSSTLNASAKELSKWMISFLQTINDTDPEFYYNMMLKPSVDSYPHIGLGFQLSNFNFKKTVGHYGGDKGFRSYLMMIPEEKIGLVVLGNCDYQEDFRQEIIHPIAKIMLAKNKSF